MPTSARPLAPRTRRFRCALAALALLSLGTALPMAAGPASTQAEAPAVSPAIFPVAAPAVLPALPDFQPVEPVLATDDCICDCMDEYVICKQACNQNATCISACAAERQRCISWCPI